MATDRPQPAIFGLGAVSDVAVCEHPVSGAVRVTIMPFMTPIVLPTITASVSVSVSVSVTMISP